MATSRGVTVNELPLELLDLVLENCFLHAMFNSSPKRTDEDVIRAIASVDFCWLQRITRRRFKKRIWRRLTGLYETTRKLSAIIRNNRNYFLEHIQPKEELIQRLLSANCVTQEQSCCIRRQRLKRDRNAELLHVVRSFNETKFTNLVRCLRQTNQKTVARIIENGGGVVAVDVKTCAASCADSMDIQLLHKAVEDLLSRTKPRSYRTNKLISQMKEEGIEILNSKLNRQALVVWIWCRSQAALAAIQKRYDVNRLADVFLGIIDFGSCSASEFIQAKVVNIDCNQFEKTVVVCDNSFNVTQWISVEDEHVFGVTKLGDEVYVLGRSRFPSPDTPNVIRVFEDQIPFSLRRKIEIREIEFPWDIGSSEKDDCLFVSDPRENCVWKITREMEQQHKILKWLTTDYAPRTLSVSNDGHLLLLAHYASVLRIYGPDATLVRSIRLAKDIRNPIHAVETFIGNFVILHQWSNVEEEERETSWKRPATIWIMTELTTDGQTVINRFIPSSEAQQLDNPCYLSLDSDDQVFVADSTNDRVILLDSDLSWNRIICRSQTNEEDGEERKLKWPERLCYDGEKKQLIVGGVNVHILYKK